MIIQFFNYIFQSFFSLFYNEINSLNDLILDKNDTIRKLNKTIRNLKSEIRILKGTSSETINETSISPKYGFFEVDLAPISVQSLKPSLDYRELIADKSIKTSKCVLDKSLPKPEQLCPRCSSPYLFHSRHSKNQKKCKCCDYHFSINRRNDNSTSNNKFCCPYCQKTLSFRVSREAFDVYVCKNRACPFRLHKIKDSKHHRDKISYIYRDIKVKINDIYNIIKDNQISSSFSFNFRKFNMDIFSKVLTIKVNLKQSNRNTAFAMKDLFGVDISHTQITKYCTQASCFASLFNMNSPIVPSCNLVADETYIKVKGKKHYVWIIYDWTNESIVSFHISDKRDTAACITAIVKAIKKYPNIPDKIKFSSDAFTAYPLALQYVSKEFGITFNHTFVKGIQIQENEDIQTRNAKQKIERLNRTFKESYRITTGYNTLKGAIASFELWMLFYNFLRIKGKSTINSIEFIKEKINISELLMPSKWTLIIDYSIKNFVT